MTTDNPAAEGERAASYENACIAAATFQGLDGITAHLRAAGYRVEVEQTGGFTMVATIYLAAPAAYPQVCVTNEGGEDDPAYIVGLYRDEESEGEPVAYEGEHGWPTYATREDATVAVATLIVRHADAVA